MLPLIPLAISLGTTGLLAYRNYKAHHNEDLKRCLREYLLTCSWEKDCIGNSPSVPVDYDPNTFTMNGEPLFIYGITHNRSAICAMLLSMKASTDVRDKEGNSPLHLAVKDNNTQLIKDLIRAKANINALNKEGKTPLFYATNSIELNLLLNAGAYPDAQDLKGRSALFFIDSYELAKMLIKRGATPTIRDKEGNTAPILNLLPNLKHPITKFKDLSEADRITLIIAMNNHDSKTVENMVTTIVTPDFMIFHKGKRIKALRFALIEKDAETAKVLLKSGAIPEDDEMIPLIYPAIETNDPTLIKQMILSGFNPTGVHLAFAIQNNYTEAGIALTPHCKKNFVYYDQRLPGLRNVLEIAVMQNNPRIVEEILKNGGNPNAFQTADMGEYAFMHKYYEVNEILRKYGNVKPRKRYYY